jgi:hypothetical protein
MKLRSPKNKFRYELTYGKAISGIGSVTSFTSNDLSNQLPLIKHHSQQAKRNNTFLNVEVFENKEIYPKINWVKIKSFNNKISYAKL